MKYRIFLTLEPYLAQWLRYENGGEYPIKMKRGSGDVVGIQRRLGMTSLRARSSALICS